MANPMYGQNKADNDINIFGRGKVNVIANGGLDKVLSADDSGAVCLFDTVGASSFALPAPVAGLEFTFDASRNAFIAPKPFPSWTLNETTCQWEAPVAQTVSHEDKWNEDTQSWYGNAS